jgi:riboflavin synthase
MFSGIVTDVGRVRAVERGRDARRFEIESAFDPKTIALGASIAHAGCCLTVVEAGPREGGAGAWHAAEVSEETLAATTLGSWEAGTRVNLEASLKLGDELGGHLVTGHVDGVGVVRAAEPAGGSVALSVEVPEDLARFIAAKGSIALDGVSLTVNRIAGSRFEVNVIPHTGEVTTLGALEPGGRVNLEIDLVARYLARLAEARLGEPDPSS